MTTEQNHLAPESLTEKIMSRIEQEHITPEPRWHFALKNILFWALLVFSVLAGACAVSASFFVAMNAGWEYSNITHKDFFSFIADSCPVLWLCAFFFLLLAGYANFRLTKRGYRYPIFAVIGCFIMASLVLGALLYKFGIGDLMERSIGPHIPMHQPIVDMQRHAWLDPAHGLLAGEVESVNENSAEFTLHAYDGNNWTVLTNNLNEQDLEILKQFKEVRIIGITDQKKDVFRACRILPWELRGRAPFLPGSRRPNPLPLKPPMPPTRTDIERNDHIERNTECEGVRPYRLFR